jgi:hypothetical protein
MSVEITGQVRCLFAEWGQANVRYVVMRGWTGAELAGSDIDILVDVAHWQTAVSLAERAGFQQVTRGWKLFEWGAKERYLDKTIDGRPVRLHLSDRLLFGKPMRKIRLPYETAVLRHATFAPGAHCYKCDLAWQQVIDLYRVAIDKPDSVNRILTTDWELDIGLLPSPLVDSIKKLLTGLDQFANGRLSTAQLEARAIASLAPLPGSQYRLRQAQAAVSFFLLFAARLFHKLLLLVGLKGKSRTN